MSFAAADPPSLTPQQVVAELDKFIVGQQPAKRAVAIALRNRWRRRRVPGQLGEEIAPKNIILVGATGVGKTEIARRLARLAQAPFVKVEASKFTEVGYVGRDCEAMVRDLVEAAVVMVGKEAQEAVKGQAETLAEERLLDLMLPQPPGYVRAQAASDDDRAAKEALRQRLGRGELDEREVEVEVTARALPNFSHLGAQSPEDLGNSLQQLFGQVLGPRRSRRRRAKVREALRLLAEEEASRLVDQEEVHREAVRRAEQGGIIFLDEIDKIARREGQGGHGPDVSREGVQRDILPIVEGSTVTTKYGPVKTDHVLFVAAGAFHVSRISDLIPELQGRFPIRVELAALQQADLLRILREPQNALPAQYAALLAAEGVTLTFTDDGLMAIAQIAAEANLRAENIGARRLHTIFEKLLEEVLFDASERAGTVLRVDHAWVRRSLHDVLDEEDLARYIL